MSAVWSVCYSAHMQVRGQPCGVGSLLLPRWGLRGSKLRLHPYLLSHFPGPHFDFIETGSHSVALAGLELAVILLPLSLECWHYGHVLTRPTEDKTVLTMKSLVTSSYASSSLRLFVHFLWLQHALGYSLLFNLSPDSCFFCTQGSPLQIVWLSAAFPRVPEQE